MAATANEVSELRAEIERLARELDQASSEKIQSAQYGLGLLEEKGLLQQKCEELETLYDNTRHELDITQEVEFMVATLYSIMNDFIIEYVLWSVPWKAWIDTFVYKF